MLVSDLGEFGLIARLREMGVVQGIGDDCAVMTPPAGFDLVMTADALIEGVHFSHEWTDWGRLGWKSFAVNLSDLAAMAAAPAGFLITLGLKNDTTVEEVLEFYDGACELIGLYRAPIVGGDIVSAPHTSISVTAFGYVEHGKAVTRAGAKPGDDLWVTNTLGDAAAGLRLLQAGEPKASVSFYTRHTRPIPWLPTSWLVAQAGIVNAMIDLSDGLAGDLAHICEESGVGAVLDEAELPMNAQLAPLGERFGWDPLDLALFGGEDYELLMAVEPGADRVMAAIQEEHPAPTLTRIGRIVEGEGISMVRNDGSTVAVEPRAFRHF
ncbi:MAG TPA: thiamine-phosphate kinase [Armatimonadota bacterium]|jgi:thiamine-monophosphate kinase